MPQIHFSKMSYVALDEMSLRQLCKISSRFANPAFLRRLKGTLQRCFQGVLYHCLENHLAKTSKNCLCEISYISLYEISFRQLCKISSRFANPTSERHPEDVFLPTGYTFRGLIVQKKGFLRKEFPPNRIFRKEQTFLSYYPLDFRGVELEMKKNMC